MNCEHVEELLSASLAVEKGWHAIHGPVTRWQIDYPCDVHTFVLLAPHDGILLGHAQI
jgi:hypothetical protein